MRATPIRASYNFDTPTARVIEKWSCKSRASLSDLNLANLFSFLAVVAAAEVVVVLLDRAEEDMIGQ